MQNSSARPAIDVGSVIADTYTIEALIGRGGMGDVFVASHKRLPGKQVAIKMLHAEIADEDVLARFRREAEIASRLGHPNIVQVHDFNVLPDGTPYLVLEFLQGETLADRLKAGPLPIEQTLSIVRQIGSALAAAHREGIVHRDLKPQNIFLVPTEIDGRIVEIAKVLDFGISKIRGSQTVKTQESSLLGTPQYMAPEQATGQHASVDERTDVFALGAIVYEMLVGHPAFSGASIPEVVFKVVYEQPVPIEQELPTLPPSIKSAVQQAMAKPAGERFATVGGFVEALTGQPLTSFRPGGAPPTPETGFATGSRVRSTGKEAFANTVGSGDHGPKPISGIEATAAANVAPSAARGSGPASDSRDQPAPVSQDTVPTPPAKRSHALVIGVAIGGAAVAAVAMYFVMRGGGEARPAAPARVAQAAVAIDAAAPRREVKAPAPKPPDPPAPPEIRKPVAADPPKPEAGKPKPPAPPKPPKVEPTQKDPPAGEPEETGDETAAQKLKDAEVALKSSELARAEQLANSVINSDSSGPAQKLHAHAIRGIIKCTHNNDEEGARIDLRPLRGAPKLRRRVISACHAAGLLREDQ